MPTLPSPVAGQDLLATWGAEVEDRLNGGNAFPASPEAGQRYYRQDLDLEFYFEGANWFSTQVFKETTVDPETVQPYAATTGSVNRAMFPNTVLGNTGILLLKAVTSFRVTSGGSALSGSHKWVCTGVKQPSGTALSATIANVNSGSSGVWRHENVNLADGAVADDVVELTWTKTGTPGTLRATTTIFYRIYF